MKLVLFDIDGTLISAGAAPGRAFNRAFQECFSCLPRVEGVKTHGVTDPDICRNIALATFGRDLIEDEYCSLNERYVELLTMEIEDEPNYRVMPGIEQLLPALNWRDDVLLGLQTGNIEPAVKPKLRRGALDTFFSLGGFGTDSSSRCEIIALAIERARSTLTRFKSLSEVVVIGDAPQDMEAGRSVGAKTIGVATGIYSVAELEAEGPYHVFLDFSDTTAAMKKIILSD